VDAFLRQENEFRSIGRDITDETSVEAAWALHPASRR